MKDENDWRAAVGAGIVLAIAISLIVTATDSWGSTNAASWVQAIGALVTIFAGVLGVMWQISSQVRRDEEQRLTRVKMIANALFQCRRSLLAYIRYAEHWNDAYRHADEANWWLDSITSFPMTELPSFGVHTTIGTMFSEAREFRRLYPPAAESLSQTLDAARHLCNGIEQAEIAIEQGLNALGTWSPDQAFHIDGISYFPAGRTAVLNKSKSKKSTKLGLQLRDRKPG